MIHRGSFSTFFRPFVGLWPSDFRGFPLWIVGKGKFGTVEEHFKLLRRLLSDTRGTWSEALLNETPKVRPRGSRRFERADWGLNAPRGTDCTGDAICRRVKRIGPLINTTHHRVTVLTVFGIPIR
eukprot:GHVH01010939.1.p2 GENE.GHVH01010939.1~~GHVH01010939.1.p2  ORF type:complete len:125 (-),score=8.28 GHVH01010939.1:436-810(-)